MLKSCSACAAKDRTIEVLEEQVSWLRLQMGTPWLTNKKEEVKSSPGFSLMQSPHMSEEELDIQHMEEAGLISPDAARAALEQIGALSTDVIIE